MLTIDEIISSEKFVEKLRLTVNDLKLPSNSRARAAGACLAIAQDHHHGIVRLVNDKLYASAASLVRVAFEAYVRGEWLHWCASDEVVTSFLMGKEPPSLNCLITQLEMLDSFDGGVLSMVKRESWGPMCGYTHTGGLHVQRWITERGIEPNYSREEIIELLKFAEVIATFAVMGTLQLANEIESMANAPDIISQRMEEWASFATLNK